MIEAMDHEIGRLLDTLQVHGQLDSTDIIFIGDNGNPPNTAQNTNTQRTKGTLYQNGINTAMVISGPSVVTPGRVSNALVNTTDLFATILEIYGFTNWQAQIASNKPVDSKSLMPILKNTASVVRPWAFSEVFATTPTANDGKTMRNLEYKLIRFDNGTEGFYHLSTDPEEMTNLLNGNLTSVQRSNYIYLCNEMTNLVNAGNFCTPTVGVINQEQQTVTTLGPNPFVDRIYIQNAPTNCMFELINAAGQVMFQGKNSEQTDFSPLPSGLYYLKMGSSTVALIKQ
jgi:hypothetical protein